MLLFIFSILMVILFVSCLSPLFLRYSRAEKLVITFLVVCANIILTLEIASLLTALNRPLAVVGIQAVFAALAFAVMRKRLTPLKGLSIKPAVTALSAFVRRNPFQSLYLGVIALLYGFILFLTLYFPQNTADTLYNHLSRIGYWLQQGSLRPYAGFNLVGVFYPYNNSLLMLWPINFIRSDLLVGTVQFFSTLVTAVVIYCLVREIGFPHKNALFSAAIFLTFPVVLFQAATAQNDMLAAAFIGAAFLFLVKTYRSADPAHLMLSALAFGLAVGTKQYAFFALPGYGLLFLAVLLKSRGSRINTAAVWTCAILVSTLLFGSYNSIQNAVYFGSAFGESDMVDYESVSSPAALADKMAVNTARLFSQFVSCEGLAPDMELDCIEIRRTVLAPLFASDTFNIEDKIYLLEDETPFSLTTRYALNEESAWFGFLSWILMIPSVIYGIFYAIRNKRADGILLILAAIIFFVITASFKFGWDPFQGRYLVASTVLVMPFTAFIFSQKTFLNKLLLTVVCLASIFIAVFSLVNNVSRPLYGRTEFYRAKWEQYPYVERVAYAIFPLLMNDRTAWTENRNFNRTTSDHSYEIALELADRHIPQDAALGIIAREGFFFDYLFFGDTFGRKISAIKIGDLAAGGQLPDVDYVLSSPAYPDPRFEGFAAVEARDGWTVLKRVGE